jgi:cytochrome c peroxidase
LRVQAFRFLKAAVSVVALLGLPAVAMPLRAQTPPADLAALKEDYKRPPAKPVTDPALVELGRLLFWDPRVSASGNTACVTCHLPYAGWSVTELRSRNDSGKLTSRRSQTLLGMGHIEGSPYGWDGRNPTLEAQARNSIATGSMSMRETATPVKVEIIEERVRAVPEYVAMFRTAMPGSPITIDTMVKAIAAYERTLEPGIAPFDRWAEGDEDAISESAKRGFALFNTTANCAVCHGGWRFTDDKFHDIGTTTTDLGRGRELKSDETMQYAFKTPTLRSIALRPPYMHNGSAATLYDVLKHYEIGGIDRPSRSAGMMPVDLTEQDRLDLVAFMQTLTGVPEGEPPPKLPGSK